MFDTTTYVSRRRTLAQAMTGIGLFPANPPSPMNYLHNTHPYVPDSTFLYYIGIAEPDLAAVIDFDSGEAVLFGDDPSLDALIWLGSNAPLAEQAAQAGIARVLPYASLTDWLQKARGDRAIHFTPPYRAEVTLSLAQWLDLPVGEISRRGSVPLIRAVVAQREIKSIDEIAEMEKALVVTREMHLTAMRLARPGVMEHDVSGAVEGVAREADRRLAYPVIFSSQGEVLHNDRHDRRLEAGDLVVHDSGCTSPKGYAGDITRTLPIGGRFAPRQRRCYELVLRTQLTAIDAARAGTPWLAVHKLAARILTEGMIEEGVFHGDAEDIVESGAYALCFQTGLGHQIGLDVHDMEGLGEDHVGYDETVSRSALFGFRNLRMAKALRPGHVVTVEPGLYFIPALIDRWESEGRYKNVIDYARARSLLPVHGIRIEDDVLITDGAARVLGPAIPKTADEMEAALAG